MADRDCRTTDGIARKNPSEAPDQIETAQIDITCQDAPNKLAELIDKVGGMDVFLLSSGIGSQNRDLNPDIELSTVQTNTVGLPEWSLPHTTTLKGKAAAN